MFRQIISNIISNIIGLFKLNKTEPKEDKSEILYSYFTKKFMLGKKNRMIHAGKANSTLTS